MLPARVSPQQWAADLAAPLPARWRRRLLARWEARGAEGADWMARQESERAANIELRQTVQALRTCETASVELDATDRELIDRADKLAAECFALATAPHLRDLANLRAAMDKRCWNAGVEPPRHPDEDRPGRPIEDGPAVARMTCPHWWRRKLRKLQGRAVEGAAIRLGLVHRNADPYVSNETLARRVEQNERNAATLEATVARNDAGQEYTLAELAATGPANKAIRRAELMTRIAGFERIALDLQHAGLFMTITCPSRFHRWRTVAGGRKCLENLRYDGTLPDDANAYLARVWARIRAALHRRGVRLYGFRIAEPQHDGTPHWHFLVFHAPTWPGRPDAAMLPRLAAIVRRYALADSGSEPGARQHRCDFKPIDAGKGTAAGYIAKYVAKNIDGYRVDKDLLGNDAMETSARVEAWAATWRIRQFQQVGGPPVGVWRELRRVEVIPEGAPAYLQAAHRAVNKTAVLEGRENASVAWDHYVKAQGGVYCGRDYRIRLAKAEQEGTGRYGDALAERVIGVQTVSRELWTPPWMAHMGGQALRLVEWIVESTRRVWTVIGRKVGGVVEAFRPRPGLDQFALRGAQAAPDVLAGELAAAARQKSGGWLFVAAPEFFAERPQAAKPWTCVNNCTEGGQLEPVEREIAGGAGCLHELQPADSGPDGPRSGPAAGRGHRAGGHDGAARAGAAVHA